MTGLEKVTGKIIADAKADAAATLARADAECAAITSRVEAAAAAERERLIEAHERECQALILRAKSSAAMARQSAILEARAAILETAYAEAETAVRSMTGQAYIDLLAKMLRSALKTQLEGEAESLRLYGEDTTPAAYEVILNDRDRDTYGERLLTTFRTGLGAKYPPAALSKLTLAKDTAPIDGGLILRCGLIEINASLEALVAETRRETEVRVGEILFGKIDAAAAASENDEDED